MFVEKVFGIKSYKGKQSGGGGPRRVLCERTSSAGASEQIRIMIGSQTDTVITIICGRQNDILLEEKIRQAYVVPKQCRTLHAHASLIPGAAAAGAAASQLHVISGWRADELLVLYDWNIWFRDIL
ncbi:hypothetical protein EVAR_102243_1 [Eumeta japonica]|uniref:Uncharacterized protein n=1 Tax=Eumeta variegata TaxID=151549 RepID=A0A4C1WEJ8_EUMVA|nr:hypothetical protein EVAR_102243_1 [Eumeta japonica]